MAGISLLPYTSSTLL